MDNSRGSSGRRGHVIRILRWDIERVHNTSIFSLIYDCYFFRKPVITIKNALRPISYASSEFSVVILPRRYGVKRFKMFGMFAVDFVPDI